MKKNIIITLIFIFIVYSGFSQQDSGKAAIHDSIIKSDINSISQVNIKKIVSAPAKEPIYKLKLGADIPIVAAGTIWSLYAFTKIYNKPLSTIEQIQSLKTSNINTFDRSAIYPYSKSLYRISNYPFYALEEAISNAVYPITNTDLQQRRVVSRAYRNRRIGDFLKEIDLTEGKSTGFPIIRDAMAGTMSLTKSLTKFLDLIAFLKEEKSCFLLRYIYFR